MNRRYAIREGCAIAAATLGMSAYQSNGAGIPLATSGYNADVVIDADPTATPGVGIDGGGNSLFEAGAKSNDGQVHTGGLPATGTFVSAAASGATYDFQPYSGANTLQLTASSTSGALGLSGLKLSELDILAASGNASGTSTGPLTINFSDGTKDTAFAYNAADWYTGGTNTEPLAISGLGRGSPNNPANWTYDTTYLGNFGLYETQIAIPLAEQGKTISSLTFGIASDAAPNTQTNVFAVSGIIAVPEPASLSLLGLGGVGLLARRRRA